MSKQVAAVETEAARELTWIEQAVAENPNQVLVLDGNNLNELIIDPTRNSRGFTPDIGDKSLGPLIEQFVGVQQDDGSFIGGIGQHTPCFATLNDDGVAVLYAGFRRARALQTIAARNADKRAFVRVLITPGVVDELDVFERSLSENVFREDMTVMQKVEALKYLTDPLSGLTVELAGKKLNMTKGQASLYLRFDMFPAAVKQALENDKLPVRAAINYVSVLPKAKELAAEGGDALLKKAQDKIAAMVANQLTKSKGKKVVSSSVDRQTRQVAGADGKVANKKQRSVKLIITEIDEQTEALKASEAKAAQKVVEMLAALKRYVNGGSLKALVKALEG
jgi:ParB-like chromosome segregation protein Spo0J